MERETIEPGAGRRVVNFTKTGKPVRHGSRSTYANHGCRCRDCLAAEHKYAGNYRRDNLERVRESKRKYWRENREALGERGRGRRLENPDIYREANRRWRERNRGVVRERGREISRAFSEANAATRSVAIRNGLPWAEGEDAVVLSEPPSMATAIELGRTLSACTYRRHYLRKKLRANGINPDTMQPFTEGENS